MAVFHDTFDVYLTPTAATPPPRLGALTPSLPERVALRLVNTIRAGRAARASGLIEKLALENLAPVPFTQLANLTGQPAMSVPAHWNALGHPCGAHFLAAVGREALLFRLAVQLEEARPWAGRTPPVHAGQPTGGALPG
jgi:amidase